MNKKKAFTLTEILVVIVVIASLAAVAVPQYKKMIEARKTGEAEAVLSAVRTEQERRCAIGKTYTTLDKLSEFVPKTETQNFTYSQSQDGQGLIASSKGNYKYSLKMLTYRDGRICCEGQDCGKFNYPSCGDFSATQAPECQAEDTEGKYEPEPPVDPCVGKKFDPVITTEKDVCDNGLVGNKVRTITTNYVCVNGNPVEGSVTQGDWDTKDCKDPCEGVTYQPQKSTIQTVCGGEWTGNKKVTTTTTYKCVAGKKEVAGTDKKEDMSDCYKEKREYVHCEDYENFPYEVEGDFEPRDYATHGYSNFLLREYYNGRKIARDFDVSGCATSAPNSEYWWVCDAQGYGGNESWCPGLHLIDREPCSEEGASDTQVDCDRDTGQVTWVWRQNCTCTRK